MGSLSELSERKNPCQSGKTPPKPVFPESATKQRFDSLKPQNSEIGVKTRFHDDFMKIHNHRRRKFLKGFH